MKSLLMRRGEAMRTLGVGWRAFAALVEDGRIVPRRTRPNGRCWYCRREIEDAAKNMDGKGRK